MKPPYPLMFIFYDAIICLILQYSIREVLGQIPEYAHWPDQDKAVKPIILT